MAAKRKPLAERVKRKPADRLHYTGAASSEFWKRISDADDGSLSLFSLACRLQSLECDVISRLRVAESRLLKAEKGK